MMNLPHTSQAESYLEALVKELGIPTSRYDQAEKSYKSLAEWLSRKDSQVAVFSPEIYVQGSFRLGTVIKPQSDDEEYDIDFVCVLNDFSKTMLSQERLKELIGEEVKQYRISKCMSKEAIEGRRCWTLEYSDGAQFHMDILPALPENDNYRQLLEARNLTSSFADTAIVITDNQEASYRLITDDWPRSNPKGYSEWFKGRQKEIFNSKRQGILDEMLRADLTASIEDVPENSVRTPLQAAIMILKHHRDINYADQQDDKPISIIISTLAAHAYNGDSSIAGALKHILAIMHTYILHDGEKYIIQNPVDPLENFADKWEEHPQRAKVFNDWLNKAKSDFDFVVSQDSYQSINERLQKSMGERVTAAALKATAPALGGGLLSSVSQASPSTPNVSFPNEPRTPKKPKGFA